MLLVNREVRSIELWDRSHVSRLRAGNTRVTFVLTSDIHQSVYASGHYGDSVQDGYRILFIRGGHTLTSLKGGRPCSLSTFNYVVAGHLAYR